VSKSIPPHEIHAGNPAKFLRKRTLREPDVAQAACTQSRSTVPNSHPR
jgi:hypothetical protein